MNYSLAASRAEQILEWLHPYCELIEIAGSIRRSRPTCNDIDLVVIPKFSERIVTVDMFTQKTVRVNLLRERLIQYIAENPAAHWLGRGAERGPEPREDAVNMLLITKAGVQLDIFTATAATWITLLICRTGSKQHNIWAAERAKNMGGHWNPYKGLTLHGAGVPLHHEEDFYTALKSPYLPPDRRDFAFAPFAPSRETFPPTQLSTEPA
jgi:DNA polymerase/3'-5' exonuclease PolX